MSNLRRSATWCLQITPCNGSSAWPYVCIAECLAIRLHCRVKGASNGPACMDKEEELSPSGLWHICRFVCLFSLLGQSHRSTSLSIHTKKTKYSHTASHLGHNLTQCVSRAAACPLWRFRPMACQLLFLTLRDMCETLRAVLWVVCAFYFGDCLASDKPILSLLCYSPLLPM